MITVYIYINFVVLRYIVSEDFSSLTVKILKVNNNNNNF